LDNAPQPIFPPEALAEIERAQQQALNAERTLREETYLNEALLRTILHDLKNPLTVTMGNLQVIQMLSGSTLSEKTLRLLGAAEEGCRSQLTIINNLSDLIKLDSGVLTYHPIPVDPLPIMKSQFQIFAKHDTQKTYTLPECNETCLLMAEPDPFMRIIKNLLENCLRHTRNGGKIEATVTPEPSTGTMHIVIQDDGEVIPAKLLDLIFDRRFQVLTDHSGKRGDVGMGLVYARTAARAMGGSLKALECNTGAKFELILNLALG